MMKAKSRCPVCLESNPSGSLFCKNCRYPIGIKKLSAFSKKELQICFINLFRTITKKSHLFDNKEYNRLYEELFSLFWLRSESALFKFSQMRVLSDLKKSYLRYPLLDMGCGDGLFISVLFGAEISKVYDGYGAIDFGQSDIYNTYRKIPRKFFIRKPSPIGCGIDIKKSAVKRAKNLGVYDDVKEGDVRQLPFEKEMFNTAFSNMINDIKREDVLTVLREVSRILKKGGYFVFTTPIEGFRKSLVYYNKSRRYRKRGDFDKAALFLGIDRGRSKWEGRSLYFWKKLLKQISFELVEYREYCSRDILRIWDTGFRPFFYHFIQIKSILERNEMLSFAKQVWVEIMKDYFFDYAKNDIAEKGSFAVLVASKRSNV